MAAMSATPANPAMSFLLMSFPPYMGDSIKDAARQPLSSDRPVAVGPAGDARGSPVHGHEGASEPRRSARSPGLASYPNRGVGKPPGHRRSLEQRAPRAARARTRSRPGRRPG